MIFAKIIIFTLVLLIISYLLGNYLLSSISDKIDLPNRVTSKLFAGFVTFWLIGFTVSSLAGLVGLSVALTINILIFCIILKGLCLFLLSRNKKPKVSSDSKPSEKDLILVLSLVAMVLIQVLVVTHYRYDQLEANRNIWIATKAYESGRLVKSLGMMNFWGMLASLMKVHPLTLIYMVIPTGLLIFYYIGYYEILMEMSHANRKVSISGVFIVSLLQIWGYQSERLVPITLLISWFGLACLIVHSLLPFSFIVVCGYRRLHPRKLPMEDENEEIEDEEYQEEWDMKKHKIINARNLAIALGFLTIMLIAFVFILNNKINTLHDSTVNMQEDLNKRCAVYDFAPQGLDVEGYLLKGTDGSLTMIGGGSAKSGDELYDFLAKYGDSLSNWYLYGIDEEDAGGYIYCVNEKGLKVENVYILDRMKLDELMK